MELYSPKLHHYAHRKGVRAEITGDKISIFRGKTLLTEITHQELSMVDSDMDNHRRRVLRSGYLGYLLKSKYGHRFNVSTAHALNMAARGKQPPYCDNSSFSRVSPWYADRKVIFLKLSQELGQSCMVVFTPDGKKQIPCTVEEPLAYCRWGQKEPRHTMDKSSLANRIIRATFR